MINAIPPSFVKLRVPRGVRRPRFHRASRRFAVKKPSTRAAASTIAALLVLGCAPSTLRTVDVQDPHGDDRGPGTYAYPEGYPAGGFDLSGARLELRDDATVELSVRFATRVPVRRGVRLAQDLVRDVFLPTVDVYLDLDGEADSGVRELLPGRRARLSGRGGWELAVVLSPVPARVAELLEDPASNPQAAAARVVVPRNVTVRANRLIVSLPATLFGAAPLKRVGLAVVVTGTVYDATFRTEVQAQVRTWFVREITPKPGRCGRWEEAIDGAPCTFGGCGTCSRHPRVIDALHPTAGLQEEAMSRYVKGLIAEVPVVYVGRPEPSAPELPFAQVVERRGAILTARLPGDVDPSKLAAGRLLDGLDGEQRIKATVVVVSVVSKTLVVRVVDGKASDVTTVRFPADLRL